MRENYQEGEEMNLDDLQAWTWMCILFCPFLSLLGFSVVLPIRAIGLLAYPIVQTCAIYATIKVWKRDKTKPTTTVITVDDTTGEGILIFGSGAVISVIFWLWALIGI